MAGLLKLPARNGDGDARVVVETPRGSDAKFEYDPELQAFLPLFPPADLTDPLTARKNLAELAAAAPARDTAGMQIEDRTVPADPEVPVQPPQR